MWSLASHVVTTLFLLPVGLTRLVASTSLYLSNPTHFRSKPAYLLLLLHHPKWNNLPLYFLLISLPISSFSLSFLFLGTHRFSLLHHALLLLLFWVLAILLLLRDSSVDPALVNDALLFAFAGAAFLLEYWLTGEGVSGVVSGAVYGLSGDLVLLCGVCCLCLAVTPDAFFVEFCLCCGLVFRGIWSVQSGLCLYSDTFAPEGCKTVAVDGAGSFEMKCDLDEDALRAVALLNLLFVVYAIVVVVLGLGLYGFLARSRGFPRHVEEVGTSVVRGGSESNFVRGGPVFELE